MHENLLKRLNSGHEETRHAALAEATRLPPEELLNLIVFDAGNWSKRKRLVRAINQIFAGVLLLMILISWSHRFAIAWIFPLLMYALENCIVQSWQKRGRKSIAILTRNVGDVRFVGPTLDRLAEPSNDRD